MIGDNITSALSRFKSNKDVLWLGHRDETPPEGLGEVLSRIQFGLLESAEKVLPKKSLRLLLISPGADMRVSAESMQTLEALSSDILKVLLLPPRTRILNAEQVQLINKLQFAYVYPMLPGHELADKINSLLNTGSANRLDIATLDLEARVSRVRALVKFLKELSAVTSIEELMLVLKRELQTLQHVKEPILVYSTRHRQTRIFYFQGAQVMNRLISSVWPEILLPRINDKKDSQFLADLFSRPFARIIAVPFAINRTGGDFERVTPGVLYFEHSLSDEERAQFIDFIHDRLHPMSVALDRIFLDKDLTEASLVWERTFDGLADPIAIFDRDGKLLHANKIYNARVAEPELTVGDGEKLRVSERVYQVRTYPIVAGRDDTTSNFVAHYVDITMEQQLQRQLVQQEKMAALGRLAGNIAHELNNPLTGIRALSQVLLAQLPKEDRRHGDLIEVESAAARCQTIIRNLLDFASGEGQREWVSLNDVVTKTLPFLKTLIRNFEVVKDLSEDDVRVFVEPQLLQQVAFNLIKNACQAMGEKGKLTIRTRQIMQNGAEFCELMVADTGPGIPASIQQNVFDFFFTTKKTGHGTGLGLSLSKSIVDRYGGRIFFESKSGEGSQFFVQLPKKESP